MQSIFTDKKTKPAPADLARGLGKTLPLWNSIHEFTLQHYPAAAAEWNFGGEKYGWSFRIKDKKRVIIYLLPRDGFFKAAFVFGQKAIDQIDESDISESIKTELRQARKYAEGKGIRIDIQSSQDLNDIKKLVLIKISN